MITRLLGALVTASVAATLLVAPAAPATCRADVFPASYASYLSRTYPGRRVTAAVHDTRTGCWYGLNGSLRLTTASVIKAGILGAELLRAQDAGRGLTSWEQSRTSPMGRLSHNPPTSELYGHVGGVAGMDAFDRRMGVTSRTNTSAWGATVTTARDRTTVALKLLRGGGPVGAGARAVAWRYMSTLHPTQRWGLSAGVATSMETALKNGFYPLSGNGWRVGTTGFVRQRDTNNGYAITVLTDRSVDQFAGIKLVEDLSRRVAVLLSGPGPVHARSVDRATCTKTHGGEPWSTVTRRVGLPSSRAAEPRLPQTEARLLASLTTTAPWRCCSSAVGRTPPPCSPWP